MEKFMFLNWFDNLGVSLPVVGELIDYSRDLLLWYNGGRPQSGAAFISKLQLMEVSNSCMSNPNNFEPNCCGGRVYYVKL